MAARPVAERLPGRDRLGLTALLGVIALGASAYTVMGVGMEMSAIERTLRVGVPAVVPGKTGVGAVASAGWSAGRFGAMFLMWWMMMAAMMTPAAGPAVAALARRLRQAAPRSGIIVPGLALLAGFLAVWGGFSLFATALQWAMEMRGMLSPTGLYVTHNLLAGGILTAAGLYQFSQLKHDTLTACRRPGRWIDPAPRPAMAAAFRIGLRQGAYCVGCCWFLMAMLFFGGIMSLYCLVGILLLVQVEHWLPRGESVGLGTGAVLVLWGVLFLISATGIL